MDIQEATKRVMSSIQRLDPENATRIMGYIMIQDQGDKEMIRLAFFSDTALLSYINQAKARLGITSNDNGVNPCSNSSTIHTNNIPSPRVMIPNNGFHLTKPSSPFSRTSPRQPVSFASFLNGGGQVGNFTVPGSPGLHFHGGGNEFQSEFLVGENSVGHVPYLDDSVVDPIMSPSGRSDTLIFPYGGSGEDMGSNIVPPHHPFHRRSCSVNDAAFFEENVAGFDFNRPCMYFARGNCRNGSACKFSHGEFSGEGFEMSSPSKTGSAFDDLMRIKTFQQRLAFMGSSGGHHNPFSSYSKCMSLMDGNPRNDFSHMDLGNALSSSARQIYLTFPAESTFKEQDVTNYFSMFGPVHDVRIPYQQKRMFGFVTFVYPETVKLILAKGNPHFVCDSRVLVKPYKEKGKILERRHFRQHHLEKSDYSASLSPSAFDSRDIYDLPVGPRMLNSQEMMLRRKFEQEAELQHAIERQNLKMMNLQLMDLNNQQEHHDNHHFPHGLPRKMNQNLFTPSDAFTQEDSQDQLCSEMFQLDVGEDSSKSLAVGADDKKLGSEGTEYFDNRVGGGESCLPGSFEHILPENLFAPPTDSVAERQPSLAYASTDINNKDSAADADTSSNKTASTINMESATSI